MRHRIRKCKEIEYWESWGWTSGEDNPGMGEGDEEEVLLKYGVRSLHCVSKQCKQVGEVICHFEVLFSRKSVDFGT